MDSVEPSLQPLVTSTAELLKIRAELEQLAKLSTKQKPASDYRKRINRASERSANLVVNLAPAGIVKGAVRARAASTYLPTIPDLPRALVPQSLLGWLPDIESFASKHNFDKMVFIMIRYRKRNAALIKGIKASLKDQGLVGIVAADHNITGDLYNPVACLLACRYGIAVFDREELREKFNPNVAYELGMLTLLSRKCLILKHESLSTLQTDILMRLYEPYSTPRTALTIVERWSQEVVGPPPAPAA